MCKPINRHCKRHALISEVRAVLTCSRKATNKISSIRGGLSDGGIALFDFINEAKHLRSPRYGTRILYARLTVFISLD